MLEDILKPNETIVHRDKYSDLEYNEESFEELVITNQRIIFYRRTGLVFKKDKGQSIPLRNIESVQFHEKGVMRKKGVLEIQVKDSIIPLKGKLSEMKHLYNNILSLIE